MPVRRLTLRVLVAVTTSLSMLHLSLVGSGVVCSRGPVESAHSIPATSAPDPHVGHAPSALSAAREHSDAARQGSDHRAPVQERCCESMSSCGMTTVASVTDRASAPMLASRIPTQSDTMLGSVGTAPEPPPPKA